MTYSPQHLDRLRLRHLRLLELVDMHQSLRAVGNALNLTQPAVSQMVKDLEFAFGVTLIDRSARGVSLNAAGRMALQRARAGLATFEHLAEELQADGSPIVRVGTNPALMFQLLPTALRRLEAQNARMRLQLHTGMVGPMLQSVWDGVLDCYVGRVDWHQMPPGLSEVLRLEPLMQTDLVLACSTAHPLAGKTDVSMKDLARWEWALPPGDSNNRIALEEAMRMHGLSGPAAAIEIAADPNALMILAREMNMLTCVPRLVLDAYIASGELCVLEIPGLSLQPVKVGFVTLAENEHMTTLSTLRQALRNAAGSGGSEA